MQTPPLAVRVPEACRLNGIGRSKLYELIKAGEPGWTARTNAATSNQVNHRLRGNRASA
jgi:hypothetical protein